MRHSARLDMDQARWSREMHDLQRRLSISLQHLLLFRDRNIKIERIETPIPETSATPFSR